MKIKNPQTNQRTVKGPEMNDRDRLNDMLATEKNLTNNYNVFARKPVITICIRMYARSPNTPRGPRSV